MTANAMKAHNRHFSETKCRHVVVHPGAGGGAGRLASSGLAAELVLGWISRASLRGVGAKTDGCGLENDTDGGLDLPRSFSPMFGRSQSIGEQYSGKASLNR